MCARSCWGGPQGESDRRAGLRWVMGTMKRKRFNAFKLTPLDSVRVVIVGQDPYHPAA